MEFFFSIPDEYFLGEKLSWALNYGLKKFKAKNDGETFHFG